MMSRIICFLLLGINSVFSQSLSEKVDEYLDPLVSSRDFYGTVLFAKNGQIELAKGYGYADLEHDVKNTVTSVYHMGSLNKPITAIGVMILHQRGFLDINDAVNEYLPSYPRGAEIKIKYLLAQTSGIPSYNRFDNYAEFAGKDNTLGEVVDWFKDEALLFEPGSEYGYSNSNYTLLAYLIEVVSGKPYEEFMSDNLFQPLDMKNTGFFKYDEIVKNRAIGYSPASNEYNLKPIGFYNNSHKMGSGAIHSTVLDMLKLEDAIYTGKILKKETRTEMLTEVDDNEYGLGWGIWKRFDKNKYDHDGSSPGAVAYFSTYPDDHVTIIFLGNINTGVFHQMKYDLAAIYFNQEYEIPQHRKYVDIDPSILADYEGRYEFESGSFFDLKLIDGDLRFLWRGRGDGYLLSPLDKYSLYMRARGDQINFEPNKTGGYDATYVERSGKSKLKKIEK